jgi:hypothetical protein
MISVNNVASWAILIVVIGVICALVKLALDKLGITFPDVVIKAFWYVFIGVIVIMAIIMLSRFAGMM